MKVRDRLDDGQRDEGSRLGGGQTDTFPGARLVAVAAGAGRGIHSRGAVIPRRLVAGVRGGHWLRRVNVGRHARGPASLHREWKRREHQSHHGG